jgi:hypothetical protein
MSFDLVVEMTNTTSLPSLRQQWQAELVSHGFVVELLPSFHPGTWHGGFLPIKLISLPEKYLFGLPSIVQISGFEVSFAPSSAHFRSASGRPIAELALQCYGAATLAVITDGAYHDVQTNESYDSKSAIAQAHREIMDYQPFLDSYAKMQHPFTTWSDFTST